MDLDQINVPDRSGNIAHGPAQIAVMASTQLLSIC